MADPVTMAVIAGGAGIAKGVGGFKAGQASSQASMATAQYNQMITQINAQMEQDAGRIERTIGERNASDVAEQASYNAFLLERQAEEVEDLNEFDFFVAERQYDIFTAEKRANWGTSGVTMQGSPAVVAMADAHAAAMNLANIEQRGLQAINRVDQAAKMTKYQGKMQYNNMMQSAYMGQYASDIRRANIINEGNMDSYQNQLQAYTARAKATQALVAGISDGISAGVGAMGGMGGGSTLSPSSGAMNGPFQNLQSNSTGSFNAMGGGAGWQFK